MTNHDNHGNDPDEEKILKILADVSERKNDVIETVMATKGEAYARHLACVVEIGNLYRTTNSLMCDQYPKMVRELVFAMQEKAVVNLIEPSMMHQFPGHEPEQVARRHKECDEFHRNMTALFKQRREAETQLKAGFGDDGHNIGDF